MNDLRLAGWGCLGLMGLALCLGCGYSPDLPPLAKVTGTVTLDGKPLTRGSVQFVPDESKGITGPPSVGAIGPDGTYTMTTAGVSGAIVGWHKVAVEARQEVDLSQGSWAPSLIPEKYNNPNASGLTAEVKAGQSNVVDLALSSRP